MRANDGPSLREIAGLGSYVDQHIVPSLNSRGKALILLFRAMPDATNPLRQIWQQVIERVAERVKDFSFTIKNSNDISLQIESNKITHEELTKLLASIKIKAAVIAIPRTESGFKIQISNQTDTELVNESLHRAS